MQTLDNSSIENISVYSNIPFHLGFFDPKIENLRHFSMTQKSLSVLPLSQTDKIAIIIVDDLAELTAITVGCEHSIVITAKNSLAIMPDALSHTMIYQQSADENPQQALEKVFHALVKTYFSTELFLEPSDIYQSDAFEKGQRRINIHSLQEQQLFSEEIKTLFSPIGQDDTVILNFDLHPSSFSLDKIQDLTDIIIEHLGEKFDGDIFFSCRASSTPNQQTLIHLSYLSV